MKAFDKIIALFKRPIERRLANPERTRKILNEIIEYLGQSGIFLPDFRHRIYRKFSGSEFKPSGPSLMLGCYTTRYITEWFVMHEIGHVLWHFYDPCRDRTFRRYFGAPMPKYEEYLDIHRQFSWKGPVLHKTGFRPQGEPSPYGEKGGGEERFCELIGLMYSSKHGFHKPPSDLRAMWRACWEHGLSRMTRKRLLSLSA